MSVYSSMIALVGTYPYHTLTALFFGYVLFSQLNKGRNDNPKGLPLPPGPKGYPVIGNLFDMPTILPWLVYQDWCKTYGDVVYFKVLGQHFLVLGALQPAIDLFEKRSSNYSDRMRMPMLIELMRGDFNFGVLPYGVWWRKHRRSFHEFFHAGVVDNYIPIQRQAVHGLLRRLLVTPEDFLHHIHHAFGATIMKIVYGIDVKDSGDPYIALAEEALHGVSEAATPGAFLVDILPILKYVPSWFPGAGFQKKAAHWRQVNISFAEKPFRYVEEQMKSGKSVPSVAATLIERLPSKDDPERPMEEKLAQDVAAVAYFGGADTTASTVQALFLAMALYPEVQKKAQAEIDAVVGLNRLPEFEDRPSLPYINAVVKELLRWHLVGPFGVPHMATDAGEYNGYYIPKGTVVIGNLWSILHNPEIFSDPMDYKPERYLKDGKLDPDVLSPESVAFGFGRRVCPGRHISDNTLYLIVSSLLAVYDIKPPVDDQGNDIKLVPEFTSGAISFPLPYKCIITPRTPAAEGLIRDTAHDG